MLNRRNFLMLAGASVAVWGLTDRAQAADLAASSTVFALPPLPYAYDALEPYIDAKTMQFHHDKHHAGYVKNLNAAIAKHPALVSVSLESLLTDLSQVPDDIRTAVRNNGGGHLNHSMFWEIMSPAGGGKPSGAIAKAIQSQFGDAATLQQQFNQVGLSRFGSGWAWLVLSSDRKLKVMSTANQDSPLMEGYLPIMGNDVWEHAYYLNYQNRRADYLEAWWKVVNWPVINQRFEKAMASLSSISI